MKINIITAHITNLILFIIILVILSSLSLANYTSNDITSNDITVSNLSNEITSNDVSYKLYKPNKLYELRTITCYDKVNIKVNSRNPIQKGELRLDGCINNNNTFECACHNNEFTLRFITKNTTDNVFTFIIDYFPNDIKGKTPMQIEMLKRTTRINNIKVKSETVIDKFELNIDTQKLVFIALFGALLLVAIIIMIFKKRVIDDDEDYEPMKFDNNTDINEILKEFK